MFQTETKEKLKETARSPLLTWNCRGPTAIISSESMTGHHSTSALAIASEKTRAAAGGRFVLEFPVQGVGWRVRGSPGGESGVSRFAGVCAETGRKES